MEELDKESSIELCTKCHSKFSFPLTLVTKVLEHVQARGAFSYTQNVPILEPLLEEVEQKVYSYDSTLERFERLEKQREMLWSLKERLCGLPVVRPSIHRLPPEILLNIFSFRAESDDSESPSQCHTSLSLSHVCTLWRSLIFSESSLWTDIVIDAGPHDNLDAILAFTRLCLERSKMKPLYVDLDTSNDDSEYEYKPGLCREVFQSSARWKHATLRLHPQDLDDLDHELAASMPYLEVLQIQGDVQLYSQANLLDSDTTTRKHTKISTPNLRELSTMGKVNGDLFLRLDTSSLIVFSTEESDMDIVLDVIGKSPLLEEVDLWSPTYRYQLGLLHNSDPGSTLITSNIRSLEMQCGCASVHLFKRLHLPSLTHLKLFGDWEFNGSYDSDSDSEMDSIDNSSSVVELLRRSRPPLEMLQLQSLSFSSNELERIMEACPSIRRFHLTDCCKTRDLDRRVVTDALVRLLTVGADEKVLLPRLTDLSLFANRLSVQGDTMVAMVQSRKSNRNWRQCFALHCYEDHIGASDKERLLRLSDERVVVQVTHWREQA